MRRTPNESVKQLQELGYPQIFQQIALGLANDFVQDNCAPPDKFYQLMDKMQLPTSWVPLWEFDGEELYAFDVNNSEYLRYEYMLRKKTVIGSGYQKFITSFFLELADAGLMEHVPELAEAFNYKYLALLEQYVDAPGDDEEFLSTIRD